MVPAASLPRNHLGRIVVSGADRASYLQGLLTNDVVALKAGQGCYAAYLTAQGRMIADLHVYELGDVMLLTMAREVKDTVLAKFDQFIFSEDVQLGDVTETFFQLAIVGPDAARLVSTIVSGATVDALRALPEHGNARVQFAGRGGCQEKQVRALDPQTPDNAFAVAAHHIEGFLFQVQPLTTRSVQQGEIIRLAELRYQSVGSEAGD